MTKVDRSILSALLIASVLLIGFSITTYARYLAEQRAELKSRVLDISVAEAIGPHPDFRGNQTAPFTLIEWGDYQCPPCRATEKPLEEILNGNSHELRFTFRNLPLTSIHPLAEIAAITAEIAREQGNFWPVHNSLYTNELSPLSINGAVKIPRNDTLDHRVSVELKAKLAIRLDIATAHQLAIDSTPSFVLCCPNGKVVRLRTLNDIHDYLGH